MSHSTDFPACPKSPKLIQRVRELRKEQTPPEWKLWQVLRNRRLDGIKFKRQTVIGKYIVDFSCAEMNLVIELDGGQHAGQTEYDAIRTAFLEAEGYLVLRFWNNDVMNNLDAVVNEIQRATEERKQLFSSGK